MASVGKLVAATASALKLERSSVNLCARYLREDGLISQKGRGTSAAQMGPTDASNLLIGIMAAETIQQAPHAVKTARKAICVDDKVGRRYEESPPKRYTFLRDKAGELAPLGQALDQLVQELAAQINPNEKQHADPEEPESIPIFGLQLEVERPRSFCALSIFGGDSEFWGDPEGPLAETFLKILYQPLPPKLSDQQIKDWKREWPLRTGKQPGMRTTTEIGLQEFLTIAAGLVGAETSYSWEQLPVLRVEA